MNITKDNVLNKNYLREDIMCGGGLATLPENEIFEGYLTREENGFMFRLPVLHNCNTLSDLGLLLLNSEMHISKINHRHPFLPKYIKGDKYTLRDSIVALNKKYGLPGVRAQQKAA